MMTNDSTDNSEKKTVHHLCIGCGQLVPLCTCDPTGGKQHETELAFRQEVRNRLKLIEGKIDDILTALGVENDG